MINDTIMKQLESVGFSEDTEDVAARVPKPRLQSIHRKAPSTSARPTRQVSTLRSREAAAALAAPRPSSAPGRRVAAPKSRIASAASALMPQQTTRAPTNRAPTNPSSMRSTASAVTSNTTVGYSKGRSVSSTIRDTAAVQKAASTEALLSPETYVQLYGMPPLDSEMWIRCKAAGCFDSADEASEELEEQLPTFEEDEEADSFQLTL